MTGDEGLHERRTVRAPGRPTVCVRERCTDSINQHISFITVVLSTLRDISLWLCEEREF